MSIEISRVQYFIRPAFTRADQEGTDLAKRGNGLIDTPEEAQKAIEYGLTRLNIAYAPVAYQPILRAIDTGNSDPATGSDNLINGPEVNAAKEALLNGRSLTEVVENLAFYTPPPIPLTLTCTQDPAPVNINLSLPSRPPMSSYGRAAERLAQFLLTHAGDPPNATKTFLVNGAQATGAYHVYEDDKTHLRNGGATTSEGQVAFFNFMALRAVLTGQTAPMQNAYNYIRYFMMPHDGYASSQLPDQLLTTQLPANTPYLMHWLIDVSGRSTSGDAVFGENVTFEIYTEDHVPRPRIAQTENSFQPELGDRFPTLPSMHAFLPGNNTYNFGCATDADQWFTEGLFWAQQTGAADYTSDLKCFRQSLLRSLTSSTSGSGQPFPFPQVAQFTYYWGANMQTGIGWAGITPDIYSGYQTPAAWYIMGRPETAQKIVSFLGAAQAEYNSRYGISGPFMPVYAKDQFGWTGVDPNTEWMGFQYRSFAHLAFYYYLSSDEAARPILDTFYNWLSENLHEEENGKISLPTWLNSTGDNIGQIAEFNYSPNHHGLVAQGLLYLAAATKEEKYKALAQKLLDDAVQNRQASDGSFPDPEPRDGHNHRVTFRMAELGSALMLWDILQSEMP